MTSNTGQKPTNPYAEAYASFLEQTKNHKLTILHDDGLYRHLRVQAPGTRMWGWDVTTWPGHLATSGDIADGYMFTREPDMLAFFASAGKVSDYFSDGAPSIDVRYWAEKLCGGRANDVRRYDEKAFLRQVGSRLDDHEDYGTEAQAEHAKTLVLLRRVHKMLGLADEASAKRLQSHWVVTRGHRFNARHSDLELLWSTDLLSDEDYNTLSEDSDFSRLVDAGIDQVSPAERRGELLADARIHSEDEHTARQWLQDNDEIFGGDTWEWDSRGWDIHFLFTCYAIEWTARLYWETQQEASA